MVIMVLDHTREFFHHNSLIGEDPLDLKTTSPLLFFTRWITHYCAPVFVFLSGTSAYLYAARNKTKQQVFSFLFTRGIWLMIAEVIVINGLWSFGWSQFIMLEVFWAIGISMVFLSFLQFLPYRFLIVLGLMIVFGHNLLDGISITQPAFASVLWSLFHAPNLFQPPHAPVILVGYPFLSWLGIMICGYSLGKLYTEKEAPERKKILASLGFTLIALFIILRFINIYGDRKQWISQSSFLYTILDFIDTTKYPPSLLYALMTIGPALLLLSVSEGVSNGFTKAMRVYGKVPFVYYILHVFVLHSFARMMAAISGNGSGDALFPGSKLYPDSGYPLWAVYLVWIFVVILLYFPCKWYGDYRANHPEKKWLSYL